ncbi:hypothetical protein MKA27_17735 [[Clostridium] innocuum]|nr:hypothetical protein [[Clostridium] innocuum]MCR0370914.1 hypothetical protein [[Clostridium] innocuum]MCR0375632.1 hypothetical protein [[Clostridium] innocuum]MCR0560890.1 hypothetical protein [[Clostridium] innocuum]MCR0603664.1 hypothetical protein [[Clostridium] innocuum]
MNIHIFKNYFDYATSCIMTIDNGIFQKVFLKKIEKEQLDCFSEALHKASDKGELKAYVITEEDVEISNRVIESVLVSGYDITASAVYKPEKDSVVFLYEVDVEKKKRKGKLTLNYSENNLII